MCVNFFVRDLILWCSLFSNKESDPEKYALKLKLHNEGVRRCQYSEDGTKVLSCAASETKVCTSRVKILTLSLPLCQSLCCLRIHIHVHVHVFLFHLTFT